MSVPLVFRLAWRDLMSEKILALCLIIGLSATAAPLLLLAGLRAGLVEGVRTSLLQDPHIREISSAANRSFTGTWLFSLSKRPDVRFVMPRTRTLAASVLLVPGGRREDAKRVELLPTAPGDPLLGASPSGSVALNDENDIVLSQSAAAALHARPGDTLEMRVPRLGSAPQVAVQPLRVSAVAPTAASSRPVAFASLSLAEAVEIYREETPQRDWRIVLAQTSQDKTAFGQNALYPGFRLYAKRMEDVPALDRWLRAQGIDVVSRAGDIDRLVTLDRSLTALFALTAVLGVSGFFLALGTGMWALVQRKRLTLAAMSFFGVRPLLWFPIFQGECLALAAIGAALGGSLLMATAINRFFADALPAGQALCVLDARLCGAALAATFIGALLATLLAGWRASRVQPWEGVSAP